MLFRSVALAWRWAWALGAREDVGALPIGCGQTAPIHREVAGAPGWWGAAMLLVADGVFLASLLFGYAFLWVVAPGWPAAELIDGGALAALVTIVAACCATLLVRHTEARIKAGAYASGKIAAGLGVMVQAIVAVSLVVLGVTALPVPEGHAYAAASWALIIYAGVHALIALLCAAFAYARIAANYVSAARSTEVTVARLFADFSGLAAVLVIICLMAPQVLS